MTLKIISLGELMQEYRVWELVLSMSGIRDVECWASKMAASDARDNCVSAEIVDKYVVPALVPFQQVCLELQLRKPLLRLHTQLDERLKTATISYGDLNNQLRELRNDTDFELIDRKFVLIDPIRVSVNGRAREKWKPIIAAFQDLRVDIESALNCYAVELDTGCVFYAMRVAELGLRKLASRLGVVITDKDEEIPIEFGTWEKVIAAVRNKIEAAKKLPSNATREKAVQHYTEALDHCLYFRDRYRNPVSHARKQYNEGEASGALERVRGFVTLILEENTL